MKIKTYDFIDTETGEKFSGTNGKQIEKEINEFALKHKIINVSYAVKRVERIYRNDLPKEDEMRRILELVNK
ncbi:hypothetical protein OQG70_04915 [Streptococcus macedonicus]|uniref:hypothetical protein n=1 Tax=Streptococcus macedonicus TaxID=59310 RepID=UPI0022444DB5|nr:hypothetical protein [Streptococcus macedonicus]MCW8644608.1 hypothetical protein [Streptococcus macedonicus]